MKRDDTAGGDFAGLFTDDGTDPLAAPPAAEQRSARVRTADNTRTYLKITDLAGSVINV